MLWKANPVNFEAEGWRQSGVRMVIVSPEHQMGINGLEFIKHVVLYSCPTTFLVQLHGRFFRLSPRYACKILPKICHIPFLVQLTGINTIYDINAEHRVSGMCCANAALALIIVQLHF